jgi:hypothetical protein
MSKLAAVYDISMAKDSEDMLDLSQTNWDVELMPARVALEDGTHISDGDYRVIRRPDTNVALAFVGSRSHYNSHRQQLAKLDDLIRSGRLEPVTCSVWDNGAMLAYQLRCPELDITVHTSKGQKDMVSPLLTLAFGYGFKVADSAFFADYRWFCKNQMGKVANLVSDRARHYRGIIENYSDILSNRITEIGGELRGHYDTMRLMADYELVGDRLRHYLGACVGLTPQQADAAAMLPRNELRGSSAALGDVLDCYQTDDCGAPGSVWQAYNAVTRLLTHGTGHHKSSEATRARGMLLEEGGKKATRAFDLASRIVKGHGLGVVEATSFEVVG